MNGNASQFCPRSSALTAVSLAMLTASGWAAPLTWFPSPALDWPLSGAATVVLPGLGNVLVGGDSAYYPLSLAVTNAFWTPLPATIGVSIAGGAVANGDFIIIYGGTDGTASTSTAYGYSPSGDASQPYESMSVPRSYLGYAPDRTGNAYAIGGLDGAGQPLSSAETFNSDSNTWTPIAGLPAPLFNFPAVFDGTNSIYVFGGYNDTVSGIESASVLRYSVSANTWTTLASLPVPVAGSAAALGADGRIYVVGGLSGGVATNVVQVYDLTANVWVLASPLPQAVSAAAMGVDSLGRLVLMGGQDNTTNDVNLVWHSQQLGSPDLAPVFSSYPTTNATYLGSYASSIAASGNPQPVYLLINGPTNMVVDYLSGAVTWTPHGLAQIGAIPVTIRATNYVGYVDWNFTITVPYPRPTVPTNFYVLAATEYSVTLAWDAESPVYGAVTYGVFIPHGLPHGGYTYQLVGNTTSTNFTITGLLPNSSHSYSLNVAGPGGTSGYAGVTLTTPGPQPPTNVRITGITSTTVSFAWDPSPGPVPIVRYEILGWIGGLFPTMSYGTNFTSTSATITGLVPGTYEEYTLRAYDADGNVSGFAGAYWAVNPVAVPATLSGITPAPGGGFQFTVSEGGTSLQTVLLEASTTVADPNSWVQIGAVFPTANPFTFIDTNAAQFPIRFYRVRTP